MLTAGAEVGRAPQAYDSNARELLQTPAELGLGLVGEGTRAVHTFALALLVLWNNEAPPACWEAANAGIVERMKAP